MSFLKIKKKKSPSSPVCGANGKGEKLPDLMLQQ